MNPEHWGKFCVVNDDNVLAVHFNNIFMTPVTHT